MNKTAYLIVICGKASNVVLNVEIWSSPEWEASMLMESPTFVAFQLTATSFQEAIDLMIRQISNPRSRYHWLYLKMDHKRYHKETSKA